MDFTKMSDQRQRVAETIRARIKEGRLKKRDVEAWLSTQLAIAWAKLAKIEQTRGFASQADETAPFTAPETK